MGDPTMASLRKLFQAVFYIHVPDIPATLLLYVFIELLTHTLAASFCKSTKSAKNRVSNPMKNFTIKMCNY